MAALALSGDWAAEFLSGPESASAPGLASLSDAADADWTREFIAEAAGSVTAWYGIGLCGGGELQQTPLWGAGWQSSYLLLSLPDPGRWAEEYLEQSEEKLWLGDLGDKENEWLEHGRKSIRLGQIETIWMGEMWSTNSLINEMKEN